MNHKWEWSFNLILVQVKVISAKYCFKYDMVQLGSVESLALYSITLCACSSWTSIFNLLRLNIARWFNHQLLINFHSLTSRKLTWNCTQFDIKYGSHQSTHKHILCWWADETLPCLKQYHKSARLSISSIMDLFFCLSLARAYQRTYSFDLYMMLLQF